MSSPGKSAMHSNNNNGPSTLPWGTPDTASTLELQPPSILTLWVWLHKIFWIPFKIIPPTTASCNLNTRPLWLTLSKAPLKSIWTSANSPPLSNSIWPALMMSKRVPQVPKFFLYDYWWYGRTLELSNKRPKRKEMSLSKSLDKTGVIKIGRQLQISADKGFLGIGVTSVMRHSSGNSPECSNIRKKVTQFRGKNRNSLKKKQRETTRRVHTTIRIEIHQVPLNLTRSEGNLTECRSRMTSWRQLNDFLWLLTVKPRTQQLSLPHRIWNKCTTRRTKRRNIWLWAKDRTLERTLPSNSRGTSIKSATAISRVTSHCSPIESISRISRLEQWIPVHSSTVPAPATIGRLIQLKRKPTITIKPSRVPSSSPHCNHGDKSLHNSTNFHFKILNHGRTPENVSPIRSRLSLTSDIPINSGLEGTLRATSNPATVGDKFNVAPSDSWFDLPTLRGHSRYIDKVHLSEQDPTHHQPYEWAH